MTGEAATTGTNTDSSYLLEMAATIVSAYVTKNAVPAFELPAFITDIHAHLAKLALGPPMVPEATPLQPAVPIKKSVTNEFIVCLEDGKRFSSLKRHLGTHGMTPEQYRKKWGLPIDYPMLTPAYATQRSELAKQIGLGSKRGKAKPKQAKKAS